VFISSSLDGPWVYQGAIKIDANGFSTSGTTANLSIVVRPDGNYMIVPRSGVIMISTTGIMGPYKIQCACVYPTIAGLSSSGAEDPVVWYSGGQYHITVNYFSARKAYHLTSTDGIKNWTNQGIAYDPTTNFIRYTDGTVNHWNKIERPGVFIENGHITYFTFAVIDVDKSLELGNDTHGSKVIVVPFDGVGFDGGTPNLSNEVLPVNARALSISLKGPALMARKTFFIPAEALSGANQINIALHDLRGRSVGQEYKGPVTGSQDIGLSLDGLKISSGVYCISLRCGNRNFSSRITIQ
jgi:hypothetical protein